LPWASGQFAAAAPTWQSTGRAAARAFRRNQTDRVAPPLGGRHCRNFPVAQAPAKADTIAPTDPARVEEEVAYLAKRHRISPAIVREIIRRIGSVERSAVEREIKKGQARR
jgi:hypothetical protein